MVSSISGRKEERKEGRKKERKDSLITGQEQLVELGNGLQHLRGGRKEQRKEERKKEQKEGRTHISQDKSSWLS